MLSRHKGTKARSYTKFGLWPFVSWCLSGELCSTHATPPRSSRRTGTNIDLVRCTLGDNQRDVVVLLVRAEATNVVNYRPEQDV